MFRIIFFACAMMIGLPTVAQTDRSVTAQTQSLQTRLWRALELSDLLPIMRAEALSEAAAMQDALFERGGDNRWKQIVEEIHETGRLRQLFLDGIEDAVTEGRAELITEAVRFYESALGKQVISLEFSARKLFLDSEAESGAKAAFATAANSSRPRVAQISRLIDDAKLVDPNVAGGMNAAFAFAQGYNDGGGYQSPKTEAQLLSDAWAQEPLIRAETLGWMEAYLFTAYSPLSDAELDRYIAFASSPAGQALAEVLFAGFDSLFERTSYEMGLATAAQIQGHKL